MEDKTYCILCQEEHMTTPHCMECKGCGRRGHVRKDCPWGLKRQKQNPEKNCSLGSYALRLSLENAAEMKQSVKNDQENSEGLFDVNEFAGDDPTEYFEEFVESRSGIDNPRLFRQEEDVHIIHISSDDDHEENNEKNDDVPTFIFGNTIINEKGETTVVKPKADLTKMKYDLNPGIYNIVSVHIELFRSSKHSFASLTQIGCVAHTGDSFFRSIKPPSVEDYLDNYKLGGDLLQALHMTREDEGTFLFRSRFEDVENNNKIVCVSETEALLSFLSYLKKFPKCVILGVDEDTVAILTDKIRNIDEEKAKSNTIGFTYWKRVLKYLDVEDYKNIDLEDYLGEDLTIFKTALDIAKIVMKTVSEVSSQKKGGRKSIKRDFFKLCKKIQFLSKPKQYMPEREHDMEYIEVYSSFRPNMSATISASKLKQIVISSDSDCDEEETSRSNVGRVCSSNMVQTTSEKYWKIEKFQNGRWRKDSCVFCHGCKNRSVVHYKKIYDHIVRSHSKEILCTSLLCPVCNKAVLPSYLIFHMNYYCAPASAPTQGYYTQKPAHDLSLAGERVAQISHHDLLVCCAEGDGLHRGVLGTEATFCVLVRDHLAELTMDNKGSDGISEIMCQSASNFAMNLNVVIAAPDMKQVTWESIPDTTQSGRIMVRWTPHVEGEHIITITFKGRHIQESPFRCMVVRAVRDDGQVFVPILVFGREGTGNGELCSPWGVSCTSTGLLVVADRSNNRVQIFNRDGTFHHKFGTEGIRPGQFKRPTSVCVDTQGRLIVTDKDNHRIQIFNEEGEFILMFGEKGSGNGQLYHPWDVACNSKNQILVSDTRNYRLQLFNHSGEYLNKYEFGGLMMKPFLPIGVCFNPKDRAIVADFNNHRLLVIGTNFSDTQFIGTEGSMDGEFTRPNGVTVDDVGNIVVADLKNNRIQVFSSSGFFLRKFGGKGSSLGEFGEPGGICMTKDGLVCVVDFGNTKLKLFKT